MNEWSDFESMVVPQSFATCAVMRFILTLPEEGQLAVDKALVCGRSVAMIREALRKIRPGDAIPSAEAWRRHRNADCSCKAV